jgi:hypothetical protein
MAKSVTRAERDAILASGQPFIVATREVAKCTKSYRTDPEVLLGCIIVSGTLDTAEVLRAEVNLSYGAAITDGQRAAHIAFRRVWASPTEQERNDVLAWAEKIAGKPKHLTWSGPAS